jgi:hypothetical protein
LAIKGTPHSSAKNTETTHHCCCYVLLHFLRESLRAQNSREQTSETLSSYDTCTGRRTIKFWEVQLCVTAHLYERLLPGGASFHSTTFWWCALLYHYFQKDVCGTALLLFFLHQIRSTTSSCSTCRLFRTAPPVPPALVLPLGITWCSHVLSVIIQIKREHKQFLCCHNVAHFHSWFALWFLELKYVVKYLKI